MLINGTKRGRHNYSVLCMRKRDKAKKTSIPSNSRADARSELNFNVKVVCFVRENFSLEKIDKLASQQPLALHLREILVEVDAAVPGVYVSHDQRFAQPN